MNQFNGHERVGDNLLNAADRQEFLRGRYPDFFNGSSIDLGINKMMGIDPLLIDGMRNHPVIPLIGPLARGVPRHIPINDFKLP